MNNLQIFNSPEFGQVRTIQQNGEPWFVGKDVAERRPAQHNETGEFQQ